MESISRSGGKKMSLCRHEMNMRPKRLSKEEVEEIFDDTNKARVDE